MFIYYSFILVQKQKFLSQIMACVPFQEYEPVL